MKQLPIVILILSACFVSSAWSQSGCKANTPWAEFHLQNMRRWNPCEKEINVENVVNLRLKWAFKTQPRLQGVFSSPAVANGVLYVGAGDNNVYGLNAATGNAFGMYTTPSSIHSSPAVANEGVYIGSDDGTVYLVERRQENRPWRARR